LVLHRDRPVENRTHGKRNDAYNQPTRSNHWKPLSLVPPMYPA
jgi:hypothetical protein